MASVVLLVSRFCQPKRGFPNDTPSHGLLPGGNMIWHEWPTVHVRSTLFNLTGIVLDFLLLGKTVLVINQKFGYVL